MGNRCFESLFSKPLDNPTSITEMDAHLQPNPHTINDTTFLYFPSFFEMETDIGYAVEKGKHIDLMRQNLQTRLKQIHNYISSQPYAQQLESINQNVSKQRNKKMCYLCLQIQTVHLSFEIKTLNLRLLSNKSGQLRAITKQKMDPSRIFQLFTCTKAYVEEDDSVIIQIGDLSATLQLKEICKELAVVEVINLRKQKLLNPLGEIAIRVECIGDPGQWKAKSSRMLESRKKQIEKILQMGEITLESSAKVFLVSSVSERGCSRLSYYKDDQLEFVQFEK